MTTVATPSKEYHAQAQAWATSRVLMSGTRGMRREGRKYLPQEQAEEATAYAARLNRSTLFNAFRKTVEKMAGKVFAKPIALGEDVPPQLVAFAENINLMGRHLNDFARDVFTDALQTGVSFVLADMPPGLGEGATLADETAAGRRPYLVHIKAENLIGWQSELVGGREVLTQVRIREWPDAIDPENRWEKKAVEQIRVLELGRWEVHRKNGQNVWGMVEEGVTSLDVIPLAPVYLNRTGFMQGEPPLEDLADLNVNHWRLTSDYLNILHVAGVPILFASGMPDDAPTLIIGAGAMTRATNPQARLSYVEHSGKGIGAIKEAIDALEFQMQALGLELLIPRPGNQTATGKAIDQAAMNAPLAMMARGLQDGLEQAFGFMAEFLGLGADAGGSLTVNTDFGVSMRDAADLTTLLGAVNAGHITKETFLTELKRRGVLSDAVDPVAEVERLSGGPIALLGKPLMLADDAERETVTTALTRNRVHA